MNPEQLKSIYKSYKEKALHGRYIHTASIAPLLKQNNLKSLVKIVGESVNQTSIYKITIGSGSKKILMWSQMHGNESTSTKAIFDLLNLLTTQNDLSKMILESCTLIIIPILNPDGAKAYTRFNANDIDLNRDAQALSQPESKVLRQVFEDVKPDFCFNLHGQRTIFGAGTTGHVATVSFLAPAQDQECTITNTRKKAMEVISVMNMYLQLQIPGQVGIYDDTFNSNCVGDTFQSFNVPTILFEAGHFQNDYNRETTREYIFQSLLIAVNYIASSTISGIHFEEYFKIPENNKVFFDIIIRNTSNYDIGIQYQEQLVGQTIEFVPKIEKISDLSDFYAHNSIDARGHEVFGANHNALKEGSENDFVLINNEIFSLKLKKN